MSSAPSTSLAHFPSPPSRLDVPPLQKLDFRRSALALPASLTYLTSKIDRSIMLPDDLVDQNDDVSQVLDPDRHSRRGSGDEEGRDSASYAARG